MQPIHRPFSLQNFLNFDLLPWIEKFRISGGTERTLDSGSNICNTGVGEITVSFISAAVAHVKKGRQKKRIVGWRGTHKKVGMRFQFFRAAWVISVT